MSAEDEAREIMETFDRMVEDITGRPMYFDRAGEPISMWEWAERLADFDYKSLRRTVVGTAEVSTVWLGLDHGWSGTPMIFETMIFDTERTSTALGVEVHESDDFCQRYATEAEALEGHEAVVRALTLKESE